MGNWQSLTKFPCLFLPITQFATNIWNQKKAIILIFVFIRYNKFYSFGCMCYHLWVLVLRITHCHWEPFYPRCFNNRTPCFRLILSSKTSFSLSFLTLNEQNFIFGICCYIDWILARFGNIAKVEDWERRGAEYDSSSYISARKWMSQLFVSKNK